MMYLLKERSNLSSLIAILAVLLIPFVSLGMMSPALAQPPEMISFTSTIELQDPPATVQINDLNGNLVGQGEHSGQVRCFNNKCNRGTQLQLNGVEYRYKAKTASDIDPTSGIVLVAGTGTVTGNGQKEAFKFNAIFQDNKDGSIFVRYDASNPNASFIIPNTTGTLTFSSK
jgi:hypothetical protein